MGDTSKKTIYITESQYRSLITEFVTKNMIYLKDYLSMSDEQKKSELPGEYPWFFSDFLIELDIEFDKPTNSFINGDGDDDPGEELGDYDLVEYVMRNEPEIYSQYSNYLFDKINSNTLPIDESEYPAWSYFDGKPTIVKNQWLIHFTDNAEQIANEGFKYGVDEMSKLGLTTHLGEFEKKYGGYNFSYLLSDFNRYGKNRNRSKGYKYGNEAVIFNASGIKTWHHGDEEPQVIFYGDTARSIIPIIDGENEPWGVFNYKNNRLLFESESLEKVVQWVVQNYNQYRSVLHK